MLKIISFLLILFTPVVWANPTPPLIGIIIDDMGNHARLDDAVVNLPGAVTCSVIPYTFDSILIANKAHAANKEIIAHIPMQALEGQSLGRGGLTTALSQQQFAATLMNDIAAVPYAEGLNNHMGSLLTQQPKQMDWLMQTIQPTGLFYIDSRTTPKTVAEKIANNDNVQVLRRDVFLDDDPTPAAVAAQFARLLIIAREQGLAVAIGHPYPVTINYLQQELPLLSQQGVELVPLSQLVGDKHYAVGLSQLVQ
jgi:polysaccharide deacetylase 2 family uncharacterized protein YibQ